MPDDHSLPAKFKLPEFDPSNPELWFATVEIIFEDFNVTTERKMFAAILQSLDSTRRNDIQAIITNTQEQAQYTKAKERIIDLYGTTSEQRLDRLLSGVQTSETRPQKILQEILRLSVGMPDANNLVKRAWLGKLPRRIREIVSVIENQPLEELSKLAEKLYSMDADGDANRVCSLQQESSPNAQFYSTLCSTLRTVSDEIAAIKTHISRERERVYSRGNRRSSSSRSERRSSSPSPSYRHRKRDPSQTRRIRYYRGLCWYHHTFGDDARKCEEKCNMRPEFFKKQSKNEN